MKISVFYEHIEKACEQTKKPLSEVLAYVKACGIDGVEMDYDELVHDELAHDSQDILKNLQDAGLVISSIYGFCHLDIDPEEQKCLDVIDKAAKNGCSRVLIVPGFFNETDAKIFGECADDWEKTAAFMQSNQAVQNITEGLRRAVAYAKEKNIIVTLEDFDSTLSPCSRINALKWFMEQVPGICWTLDAGNFAYSSESILDAYEVLHIYTAHVHCKDRGTENPTSNGIVGTYNKGLRPVSAGDGYIPLDTILSYLKRDGYEGWLAVEQFGLENQYDGIARSAEYLMKNVLLK